MVCAGRAKATRVAFKTAQVSHLIVRPFSPPVALACAILLGAPAIGVFASDLDSPVIRRTTLLVDDPEHSQQFYEALGFKIWLDWSGDQDPNEPTDLPLAGSPTESRIIVMAAQNDYAGMIGLLAFDGPPLDSNRKLADRLGINDVILMIEVANFDTVRDRLVDLNTPMLRRPGPYESRGPAGLKRGRNMLIRDPDGYVVEITSVDSLIPP